MNINITTLIINCRASEELINFSDFNYIYGKISSGKSSVVRLIDYCFGGKIEFTPAFQSEFISAILKLNINNIPVEIEREINSEIVRVNWTVEQEKNTVLLPARQPGGEKIKGTNVENLSDFIFYISDIKIPKVRKSKIKEDSELARLSIRDLFWYCYIEQETIDSEFFHLEFGANPFKQLKSKDVLRLIMGFHQEQVAELEYQLEENRKKRIGLEESAKILNDILKKEKVESEVEIEKKIIRKHKEIEDLTNIISEFRNSLKSETNHALDSLRNKGRKLSNKIESFEEALLQVDELIREDESYLNELELLTPKIKRTLAARAVLNNVDFVNCPRCAKPLPNLRDKEKCNVCGQEIEKETTNEDDINIVEIDKDSRVKELKENIESRINQSENIKIVIKDLYDEKKMNDRKITEFTKDYDSIYLSNMLLNEKNKSTLEQEIQELEKLKQFPKNVEESLNESDKLRSEESRIRRELNKLRILAEKDLNNLKRLEELFLDSLVRSKIPGFNIEDEVKISSPHFLPQITSPESGEMIISSFENLGSGGKKTLFKVCFLLAIHRLANETGAFLPNLIIIDSPMKNISERENVDIFNGFYEFLYQLAESELSDTQFIIVDKEFIKPSEKFSRSFFSRYMAPNDSKNPPLISYYNGL